jgi:CheY-like chemotaxis protein
MSSGRGLHAQRLLLRLPTLGEGTLRSADLALWTGRGLLALALRLEDGPASARVRERLAFWLAREGGWCRAVEEMGPAEAERFGALFSGSDVLARGVGPDAWDESVRRVFAQAGAPPAGVVPPEPELRLHAGGRSWQGFAFDAATGLLEVPSPLAPPAGDVLRVALDGAAAGRGTVVAVRRSAGASPLVPAGFTLALTGVPDAAAKRLDESCRQLAGIHCSRASPRFPVIARASVGGPDEEVRYDSGEAFLRDYATNLSHGGAFVRTAHRRAIGDRIELHLRLPDGSELGIPATVVHRTADGLGLQFELTPGVEGSLSAAIAGLAGRPRRVLVVDDDALVRQILADCFSERGFEVITAPNGEAGLRAITDELFALDAVVTDVLMPGLSGEALVSAVRTAGGEADLVLVVASGAADAELTTRLALAGADRVLSKSAGADQVVDAVEEALAIRAAPPPTPDPFLPAPREGLAAAAG